MWREPVRGAIPDRSFFGLPGIDQVRAFQRGLVSATPLVRLTGLRLTQAAPGNATFTMDASPWLQHPEGSLDLCILVETALTAAVITGAPPSSDVRIAVLSMKFLRPTSVRSGTLIARARTVSSGRTYTFAEVVVEDALGRHVALGGGSATISPMDPPAGPPPGELRPVGEPVYPTPDPPARPLPPELVPRHAFDEMDGLSWVRSVFSGEYPVPFHALTGMRLTDAQEGSCTVTIPATEWLCGTDRRVAEGTIASAAFAALGVSPMTLSPGGRHLGVLDLSVSFLRDVQPDGRDVVARAKVVHAGDILAATAEVTDADGNRVALGHLTGLFVPSRAAGRAAAPERVLATVLFTDIVSSTERAARAGDAQWRQVLEQHNALVRGAVGTFKGREVKTVGDGFLVSFDSPARAVLCARAIRDDVKRLRIEVRAGVHTGECEVMGADLAGIAVHVARRVTDAAGAGEILVSGTVRDLVAGSGLRFEDRGAHSLKGVPEDTRLFALAE